MPKLCMYNDFIVCALKAFTHHAEGNQTWHICGVLGSVKRFPLASGNVAFGHWRRDPLTDTDEFDSRVGTPSDKQQLVSH